MARVEPLNIFIAVVDSRSFTQASRKLGLTPSAVSKQISHLEERLNTQLLHRTTRSVAPTEAGQIYYDRCRQILDALDEVESQIHAYDSEPRGRLRIYAQPYFGRVALARIFQGFVTRHPDVFIDLVLSQEQHHLAKDSFDVSIHLEEAAADRLISRHFAEVPTILCASKEYLARHPEPTNESALKEHQWIETTTSGNTRLPGSRFPRTLITNDLDMAFHAIREGMGIGLVPQYMARRDIEREFLHQLLPNIELNAQSVWVSYAKLQRKSTKIMAFVDYLFGVLNVPA